MIESWELILVRASLIDTRSTVLKYILYYFDWMSLKNHNWKSGIFFNPV